jgi:hypothetical protein
MVSAKAESACLATKLSENPPPGAPATESSFTLPFSVWASKQEPLARHDLHAARPVLEVENHAGAGLFTASY